MAQKFEFEIVDKTKTKECDLCGGTGFILRPKKVVDEETGEERVEHEKIVCPKCGGTGKLEFKEELTIWTQRLDPMVLVGIEQRAWDYVGDKMPYRENNWRRLDAIMSTMIIKTEPEWPKTFSQMVEKLVNEMGYDRSEAYRVVKRIYDRLYWFAFYGRIVED